MEDGVHGLDPTRFPEDVEHGGVGEMVVLESLDSGGPVEEEPSFLHRRVGFQDAVDYVRIPFDPEMWKLFPSRFPGGAFEDVIDIGYDVSGVNRGVWGLCFRKFSFLEESVCGS